MCGDCPPLVTLLRPVIANLCKAIPVAKEEGALERNILVRTQRDRDRKRERERESERQVGLGLGLLFPHK